MTIHEKKNFNFNSHAYMYTHYIYIKHCEVCNVTPAKVHVALYVKPSLWANAICAPPLPAYLVPVFAHLLHEVHM